ncbi:MAG: hypothetical protein FVQ81_05445 [Candidatus Glassbacteria bacterium]|nr:hypothetical protein [Candidatus Glassbacteria bacterium]
MVTPVFASSTRIAWSSKRQSAFGSPLVEADMDRFLKLQEPLIVNETAEHWSDRGSVGSGHDWTEQRGRERQSVQFSIPDQALPVDFIGYLLGLLFSAETAQTTAGGANEHNCSFQSLDSRPAAWTTTLAVGEDDLSYYIQDAAVTGLTISGSRTDRLQAGAELVASKIGGTVTGNNWPAASALRYLYSYAGTFSLDGDDSRTAQLRDFSLNLNSGINAELAWQKASSESERLHPSWWPYSPERSMTLNISLLGSTGDLDTFRTAQQQATPMSVVISCLGEVIGGTSPPENDLVEITIPQAVFTGLDYSYEDGMMVISLTAEGDYHASTGGPLAICTVEGSVPEYFV